MGKPVVFVIGASGNIGTAAVQSLAKKYSDKVEIRAGVRIPDKADKLRTIPGVVVVQATMGDKENLKSTLKGVDALYIVTPGVENRAQLTIATAEAAKDAGVKYLLVVSVSTARLTSTIYGAQFSEIEDKIEELGVPYTVLRLPYFLENLWGSKDSIVGQGAISSPLNPETSFASVSAEDAGKAAASILANPSKHAGKIYDIVSDEQTYNDITQSFSKALGREINYDHAPYEATKQALLGAGFPEWRIDAFIEVMKLMDAGAPGTIITDLSHFEKITGEKPTSFSDWISRNAPGFK